MARFETEVLTAAGNRTALTDLPGQWIDRVHDRNPPKWITLDMDGSVSPTHGAQERTAWNGHFGCMCYHPLFVFNQFGHLEPCALRPGNVHSADGWAEVLKPVIVRYAVLPGRCCLLFPRVGFVVTNQPEEMADWSLTSLQTRVIKIGARGVRHARAITSQFAEVAVSGDLFKFKRSGLKKCKSYLSKVDLRKSIKSARNVKEKAKPC